jgi:tetratricopeptide (TPR) repeat protein
MFRLSLAILLTAAVADTPAAAASLDQQLLADAADGRLDEFDFVSACLIAGGTSDSAEFLELRSRWANLQRRRGAFAAGHLSAAHLARELHAVLHAEIFAGNYRSDASALALAIRGGDFNCLSATALYWELASQAGIDLEIWSRPGHVYLVEPDSGIAIEPGAKSWGIHSPAGNSRRPTAPSRHITPLQLVGKFYYNRGLMLLQQARHAEGLACIRASLRLDPGDREARGNLLAGLNNWAVALCEQERFNEARLLIEQGLATDPDYLPLVANARYLQARSAR